MPSSPDLAEPQDIAKQLGLIVGLINSSGPDEPLRRWFEYRAYVELIDYLSERDLLPQNYTVFEPDAASLGQWIMGRGNLSRRFLDEILRLLTEAGSDAIREICDFYCKYKDKLV